LNIIIYGKFTQNFKIIVEIQSFRILLFLLLLYGGRRSSYVMVEPVWNLAAAVDEIEIEVE
jgi:hypothetical protein